MTLPFLNIHPGAAMGAEPVEGLKRIVGSLRLMAPLLEDGELRLLLEATAGQGTLLGASFEELGFLVGTLKGEIPIGVCLDTCHIFAAGYDIRTPEAWNHTLQAFDTHIGLAHLHAFHLNDSVYGLGSRKDRHANLGEGMIGMDSFAFLMQDERTCGLPKYLETPGGCQKWEGEIAALRGLIG